MVLLVMLRSALVRVFGVYLRAVVRSKPLHCERDQMPCGRLAEPEFGNRPTGSLFSQGDQASQRLKSLMSAKTFSGGDDDDGLNLWFPYALWLPGIGASCPFSALPP